jgi:hypothetical protein
MGFNRVIMTRLKVEDEVVKKKINIIGIKRATNLSKRFADGQTF